MKQMQVIGHLGKDAEIVHHQGDAFLSFNLAVSERYQDQEKTTWIKCTSNQTKIAEFLKKGKQVFCQGNFNMNTYYSEKYNKTLPEIRLNCNTIRLLTPKGDTQEKSEENPAAEFSQSDDLPF